MELKNCVHVVEKIFQNTLSDLYKTKRNIPVINNLHHLNPYSKKQEKKKVLSMEHGLLERRRKRYSQHR